MKILWIREGYSRQYLAVKFPLIDAHGKTISVCGVATDITERKQAEEALRDSEEHFRALVDMSSQIVWTVRADGQVLDPVPSWEAFTGQTFEESIGEGWANVIHSEDRERTLGHWHHCSSTGEQFEMEYRLWHCADPKLALDKSLRSLFAIRTGAFVRGWACTATSPNANKPPRRCN